MVTETLMNTCVAHSGWYKSRDGNEYIQDKSRDGIVTWIEFLDYYKDISVGIDRDDYFELMMRNAWHISGGEGAAQNTSCLRVLVTHTDGSQTIEEVQNDLGVDHKDRDGIKARLKEQGIKDIKEIQAV